MKRGSSNKNFLIALNKPSGISSHDLVNEYRRKINERRIGHMGTLDPLAEGLMILGVGQAARLNQFLEEEDKTYIVDIKFGQATNTFDAEGTVTKTGPIPQGIDVSEFVGKQQQTPPAFSAVKINGKPAYVSARKGRDVKLPSRKIEVYAACITDNSRAEEGIWSVELHVSKGTYIRSLVHDFGEKMGCPAHVLGLKRTKIGAISLDDAGRIIDPCSLLGFEEYLVTDKEAEDVLCGRMLNLEGFSGNVSVLHNNKLLAIYNEGKAVCVFSNNGGIQRS